MTSTSRLTTRRSLSQVVSNESTRPRFRLTVAGWNGLALNGGEVDIFYPLEDFPYSDPRQPLHIKGSAADEQHLLRWLNEQGLDAVPLTRYFTEIFASSTIPILLILSVLLCLVLSAGHVLARSREVGVHRLLGLSVAETTSIEIKRQSITLVLAYLGAPLLVAGLLYGLFRF